MSYRRVLISGLEAAKNSSLVDGVTIALPLPFPAEYAPSSSDRSYQSSPKSNLKRYRTPSINWDRDDEALEVVSPNFKALEEIQKQSHENSYGSMTWEPQGESKKSEPKELSKESSSPEMIKIYVGAEKQQYSIHKKLICSVSPFFDRAFNGPFVEATPSSIHLDEDSPEIFSSFFEYLYTDHFINRGNVQQLIDLYIFADKCQVEKLKNVTMDKIQDTLRHHKEAIPIDAMLHIFENTFDSSTAPLRSFCAALLSNCILRPEKWHKANPHFAEEAFSTIPELLAEFVAFQGKMSTKWFDLKEDPRHRHLHDENGNSRICDFHSHPDGETCDSEPNCWEHCARPSHHCRECCDEWPDENDCDVEHAECYDSYFEDNENGGFHCYYGHRRPGRQGHKRRKL